MRARLILNGKKADRLDVRAAVANLRGAGHDLEVRVTWERGDAARMVAEAAVDGVPRVIAGGGDGSINEAATGLLALPADQRPALGILPLGTANDFATACGIPAEPAAALQLALTGEPAGIDAGRCNDGIFVNVASGGFGAEITADTPVALKNFLGGGAYTLMGLLKAIHSAKKRCHSCTDSCCEPACDAGVACCEPACDAGNGCCEPGCAADSCCEPACGAYTAEPAMAPVPDASASNGMTGRFFAAFSK